eukprot:COSAG02_NODE_108_length_36286_cov_19.437478_7_plen_346_part_00
MGDATGYMYSDGSIVATTAGSASGEPGIDWRWWVGVGLGLGATLLATLSKIAMKHAHNVTAAAGKPTRWSRCYLALGLALLALNPPMDVAAFAFAPQSVVAATAGSASVFNLMLAPCTLRESPSRWDVFGAVLVTVGCIGVGIYSDKTPEDYSYSELMGFFAEPTFVKFSVGVVLWIALLSSGCILTVEGKIAMLMQKMAWGAISGSVGGFYVFLKCSVSWVGGDGWAAWGHWQAWLVLIGAIATAVGGVWLLNEGLRRYDALFIAPTYQAMLVVMGSVSGLVFFGEAHEHAWGYAWSLVVIVLGSMTCVLSPPSAADQHEKVPLSSVRVPDDSEFSTSSVQARV